VEIDTAHFKGNFPESCELHAVHSDEMIPSPHHSDWTLILPRTKLGPHRQHYFQLDSVANKAYTHVKITIYPDGGIKRIRLLGSRVEGNVDAVTAPASAVEKDEAATTGTTSAPAGTPKNGPVLPVLPLTAEAFASFGQVVQAYSDHDAAPRGTKITGANQGSASKFHKLALLTQSYPAEMGATGGLSVFRCKPLPVRPGEEWEIKLLERHPYTNQAFIPMSGRPGGVEGDDALGAFGTSYLVIVAQNGTDDKPDLATMRVFVAHGGQGIVYATGIWRERSSFPFFRSPSHRLPMQTILWPFCMR
jgi:allantoicase